MCQLSFESCRIKVSSTTASQYVIGDDRFLFRSTSRPWEVVWRPQSSPSVTSFLLLWGEAFYSLLLKYRMFNMCCLFRKCDGRFETIFLNGHLHGDQVVYGMGYRYIFVSCSNCSGFIGLSFIDLMLLQMKILGSSRLVSTVHFFLPQQVFGDIFVETFFPVLWIRMGFSADPDSTRTQHFWSVWIRIQLRTRIQDVDNQKL